MGMIKLTDGYSIVPEGTYVFQIVEVKNNDDFGKLEITLKTQDGYKHTERFSLLKNNGEMNEGACNAFSYFAKTAMNDFTLKEINPEELIGHFIECDVEHEEVPSNRKPGQINTYSRLTNKRVSDGWDVPTDAPAPVNLNGKTLMDILG